MRSSTGRPKTPKEETSEMKEPSMGTKGATKGTKKAKSKGKGKVTRHLTELRKPSGETSLVDRSKNKKKNKK